MGLFLKSASLTLTILTMVVPRGQAAPLTAGAASTSLCGLDSSPLPLTDQLTALVTEANYAVNVCRTMVAKLNGTALTLTEVQDATDKKALAQTKLPQWVGAAPGAEVVMNPSDLQKQYGDLSIYFLSMNRELASVNSGERDPEMEEVQRAIKIVMCKVYGVLKTTNSQHEPVQTTLNPGLDHGSESPDGKMRAKKMFVTIYGARSYLRDMALYFEAVGRNS